MVGGRLLRITARSQDGSCLFAISGVDPATGQEVWRRAGINLRTADNAGCAQREDPQGARNVLVGVGPDGREAVLDGYNGRLLWVGADGERLLAVDDRYAVARAADQRSVVARGLAGEQVLWTRPAGGKAGAALTPYAASSWTRSRPGSSRSTRVPVGSWPSCGPRRTRSRSVPAAW